MKRSLFLISQKQKLEIFPSFLYNYVVSYSESDQMASILVIDDDNLMRDMLIRMVALQGHDVKGAEDGWIAEKLLRDSAFDLVITDIIMPEKEGLETIMYIHKQYPTTPIIAISGGERIEPESYLQLAKTLGAHYTFSKPFNRHDFIEAINYCLDIKQTVM